MYRVQLLFAAASARYFIPAAFVSQPAPPGLQTAQFLPHAAPIAMPASQSVNSVPSATSSSAWLLGGISIVALGLSGAKKVSAAATPGALQAYREVDLLPRTGEAFWAPEASGGLFKPKEKPENFFDGQVLSLSVRLGNQNTDSRLPLRGLRLRFCRELVDSADLPGAAFRLEKVSDPWFIGMDGKKDIEVEGGAWSATPGLGSNAPEWGRLSDGSGKGKFCLRFWVDVKNSASKGDVGLVAGTRLFFAINVIDKKELPTLRAQVEELGEKVLYYEKGGPRLEAAETKLQKFLKWRALVSGYDGYRMTVAKWKTLGTGVPSPSEKVVDLGGLYAHSDGVVGLVKDASSFMSSSKTFGRAGSFTINEQAED